MRAALLLLMLAGCTTTLAPLEFAEGVCADPAFVGSGVSDVSRRGPDFLVSDIQTKYGLVSIYQGCCSSVSRDRKTRFAKIDGQQVYRTSDENGFTGYLTTRIVDYEGGEAHHQAHFFGPGLTGDNDDLEFFRTVRLGDYAANRCSQATREAET